MGCIAHDRRVVAISDDQTGLPRQVPFFLENAREVGRNGPEEAIAIFKIIASTCRRRPNRPWRP